MVYAYMVQRTNKIEVKIMTTKARDLNLDDRNEDCANNGFFKGMPSPGFMRACMLPLPRAGGAACSTIEDGRMKACAEWEENRERAVRASSSPACGDASAAAAARGWG
jgi:hypothetical protein